MSYAAALRGEQPPPPEPQQRPQLQPEAQQPAAAQSRRGRQAEQRQQQPQPQLRELLREEPAKERRKPLSYADAVGRRTTLAPASDDQQQEKGEAAADPPTPLTSLAAAEGSPSSPPTLGCPASGGGGDDVAAEEAVEVSEEQRQVIEEICASPRTQAVAAQLLVAKMRREREQQQQRADGDPDGDLLRAWVEAPGQSDLPFGIPVAPPPPPLPVLPLPANPSKRALRAHHASTFIVATLQAAYPAPVNVKELQQQLAWKKTYAGQLGSLHTFVRDFGAGHFHYTGKSMVQLSKRYVPHGAPPGGVPPEEGRAAGMYQGRAGVDAWRGECSTPGSAKPAPEIGDDEDGSPGELSPVRHSSEAGDDEGAAAVCPMP